MANSLLGIIRTRLEKHSNNAFKLFLSPHRLEFHFQSAGFIGLDENYFWQNQLSEASHFYGLAPRMAHYILKVKSDWYA
jgi:hypothetical protein